MKKFCVAFLWVLSLMNPKIGECDQLENFARYQVETILKEYKLEDSIVGSTLLDGFRSLSPELLTGIAKSFYLLNQCLPQLLENGSYLEFGLYRGFSLWFAQQIGQRVAKPNFQYFGFDSFAGLPDQSIDYIGGAWVPGLYAASLEEVTENLRNYQANFSNLHLTKGWFSPQLFSDWEREYNNIKPAIITIDADVYEACRDILQFFSLRHIQLGSIFLFDDFLSKHPVPGKVFDESVNEGGERKAIIEFLSERKDFKLMHLFPFGYHGYAFMVTACNGESLDERTLESVKALIGNPELPEHPFLP